MLDVASSAVVDVRGFSLPENHFVSPMVIKEETARRLPGVEMYVIYIVCNNDTERTLMSGRTVLYWWHAQDVDVES